MSYKQKLSHLLGGSLIIQKSIVLVSTDFIGQRRDVALVRKPSWNRHTLYDPKLYKKQLTNNKDPEMDDEPYIVLPPDNTISTKEEAFKLDEEVNPEKTGGQKPTLTATETTMPTQTTTPSTTAQTTPLVTTQILTSGTTIPPTTLPPPPLTTKPTEKIQEINIQAETLKSTFPTSPTNINLNLEIADPGEGHESEQQGIEPMPTVRSAYPLISQEESSEQPTPKIIIAAIPSLSDASPTQQPRIIVAQPGGQVQPPQQIVVLPQPTLAPISATVQTAQAQAQYVIAAPLPTQSSSPVILNQPAPIPVAAPRSQVTVSSFPPASITINSPPSNPPMGAINNMIVPPSSTNPQAGPIYSMNTGGFPFPLLPAFPAMASPVTQFSSLASSPLLSPLPQGYDPLIYNSLTGMFANAIRNALVQPQPYALASALALGASQAQARNQPLDILTAALTQALAQNIQQGIQPISNTKLLQALSQAISQAQSPGTAAASYPPQQQPQAQPQPPPSLPPRQPLPPLQSPQPAPNPQPPPIYYPIPVPANPVIPLSQPMRDSTTDKSNEHFSMNTVGKALAKALIKSAKRIADQNQSLNTYRRTQSRRRHRDRDDEHLRERSYVPSIAPPSPDLNYKNYNRVTKRTGDDMRAFFSLFRDFWGTLSSRCRITRCHR